MRVRLRLLRALLGTSWRASWGRLGRCLDEVQDGTLYIDEIPPHANFTPNKKRLSRNLYYQGTGSETMRERLFARK